LITSLWKQFWKELKNRYAKDRGRHG